MKTSFLFFSNMRLNKEQAFSIDRSSLDRPFYTTSEAADALGITAGRVRQMVISGEIKAEKVGRDLLIPAAEVERAMSRKTKPGPKAAEAAPALSKKVKMTHGNHPYLCSAEHRLTWLPWGDKDFTENCEELHRIICRSTAMRRTI